MTQTANRAMGPDELDEVLFQSHLVTVGRFRAKPDRPLFRDSGPTQRPIFVFPRTSVIIRHEGGPSFTADPCTVTFYNTGQRYTREPLDPRGDASEWFSVRGDVLGVTIACFDPTRADHADTPFARPWAPGGPDSYIQQRSVVDYVSARSEVDGFLVDELVLDLFGRVLAHSHGTPKADRRDRRRPAEITEEVRQYLAARFTEDIQLEDVANAVGLSVFHLCRVFRQETGRTIHQYRHQLRLRTSLEMVADNRVDLTRVALQLGFSSHSHFTAAFRQVFSTTPSAFRRSASTKLLRELARRSS